ncbi:hypothetical protein D9M70_633340 [compost metagenome]
MLAIMQNGFSRLKLERQVGSAGKYGIWEYHCAENSQMFAGLQAGRHAAVLPAEPKEGQEVEFFALLKPGAPQEEWKPLGKGTATFNRF